MTPLSLPSRTKHSDRTWKLAQRTPRPSRCSAAFLFRSRSPSCCMFFFFQAEDGIRDKLVTGVQTCALPILPCGLHRALELFSAGDLGDAEGRPRAGRLHEDGIGEPVGIDVLVVPDGPEVRRSEERRVGKECRTAWRRSR